jgi:hypothetical protein
MALDMPPIVLNGNYIGLPKLPRDAKGALTAPPEGKFAIVLPAQSSNPFNPTYSWNSQQLNPQMSGIWAMWVDNSETGGTLIGIQCGVTVPPSNFRYVCPAGFQGYLPTFAALPLNLNVQWTLPSTRGPIIVLFNFPLIIGGQGTMSAGAHV